MRIGKRQMVFEGKLFGVEQMEVESGRSGLHTFQVVRHPGGAGVLPVHEDGSVSLVRQARPAVNDWLLEVPAGRLEQGEPPLECAVRELEEETGLSAARVIPLGMIHSSPGVFDEIIYLFAAIGLTQGESHPEADEEIDVVRLPLDQALQMAATGGISDGKTIAALLRWKLHLECTSDAPPAEGP